MSSSIASFKLVLTCEKRKFKGTLSQHYVTPICLHGKWEVAIVSLNYNQRGEEDGIAKHLFIFSNIVHYTHVNGKMMQFLDYYDTRSSMSPFPRYLPVLKKRITNINIEIRSEVDDEEEPFIVESEHSFSADAVVVCVLHFRKV